jgi:hypothetical protein
MALRYFSCGLFEINKIKGQMFYLFCEIFLDLPPINVLASKGASN